MEGTKTVYEKSFKIGENQGELRILVDDKLLNITLAKEIPTIIISKLEGEPSVTIEVGREFDFRLGVKIFSTSEIHEVVVEKIRKHLEKYPFYLFLTEEYHKPSSEGGLSSTVLYYTKGGAPFSVNLWKRLGMEDETIYTEVANSILYTLRKFVKEQQRDAKVIISYFVSLHRLLDYERERIRTIHPLEAWWETHPDESPTLDFIVVWLTIHAVPQIRNQKVLETLGEFFRYYSEGESKFKILLRYEKEGDVYEVKFP